MSPCEHDWRVDPHCVLLSNPPQQRLVCVKCGGVDSRPVPGYVQFPADPNDWKPATYEP